ncbi:MAG TPA: hypothetical protein VJJ26_05445 [Candidatus Babeliales bacterium]|nr:hypothetical protein [Candidatus Babeliales bacterium]
MKTIRKNIVALSCLLFNCIIVSMDRPTIQVRILINPDKISAFYQTQNRHEHASTIGITSCEEDPMLPIIAIVKEKNGSTLDWTKNVPTVIREYETKLLTNQNLSFAEQLPKAVVIESLILPSALPARLAYNCSNGSTINFIIHGFPVEATFGGNEATFDSKKVTFAERYNRVTERFYRYPTIYLSQTEKNKLAAANVLTKKENPRCNILICKCPQFIYENGKKGCTNIEQSMIEKRTKAYNNSKFWFVMNRQLGIKQQSEKWNKQHIFPKIPPK